MPANRPTYRAPRTTPRPRTPGRAKRSPRTRRLGTWSLRLLVGAIGVLTVVVVARAGYAIVLVPLVVVVVLAVVIDRSRARRTRPPLRIARPPAPSNARRPLPGPRSPAVRRVPASPPPGRQPRPGR